MQIDLNRMGGGKERSSVRRKQQRPLNVFKILKLRHNCLLPVKGKRYSISLLTNPELWSVAWRIVKPRTNQEENSYQNNDHSSKSSIKSIPPIRRKQRTRWHENIPQNTWLENNSESRLTPQKQNNGKPVESISHITAITSSRNHFESKEIFKK